MRYTIIFYDNIKYENAHDKEDISGNWYKDAQLWCGPFEDMPAHLAPYYHVLFAALPVDENTFDAKHVVIDQTGEMYVARGDAGTHADVYLHAEALQALGLMEAT